jgi:hypothetical protein
MPDNLSVMRKVLILSIAVIFVAAAASSRDADRRNDLRLQVPSVEAPKLETARLFSASIDRFDVTNSVHVSQPTAVNWPDVPKPKLEKRSASASETPKVTSAPATKKSSPKKQAAKVHASRAVKADR